MRYEYVVSPQPTGWIVRRGQTTPLFFSTQEAALRAAENLANRAFEAGDTAVVRLAEAEVDLERRPGAQRSSPPA
jgi:hypothetical protein